LYEYIFHVDMAETPELLDVNTDERHRSYLAAVEGQELHELRPRVAKQLLHLDDRWLDRLRDAGLLPLARTLQAGDGQDGGAKKRMQLDRTLLAVLADRWRPETHTFHLPCGEMASTLQDMSYLLGLPIAGEAVDSVAVPPFWRAELQERFAPANPPLVLNVPDFPGPAKSWVIQFRAQDLHPLAGPYEVSRCLEAYLLWFFNSVSSGAANR
jgi:hypothetical protein